MTDVFNLSLPALRASYATGEETPRSLILKLRAQAAAQSPFNAWIHLLSEAALLPYLDALDAADPSSLPLWGVPFAIKDNIDLAGVPTTAACEAFSYVPERSAPVVEALIAAGAVPLGKTNLDQFATGLVGTRSPWGEGHNVFNPDFISGGSSAGSAIATALGQVTFALGTDTAGSGRIPAAFNNLIGHKPTKGLLSTRGVVPACKSLDCVTIMALTVADTIEVLDIAAQFDPEDPYARPNTPFNRGAYWQPTNPGAFRFGVPTVVDTDGDARALALFRETEAALTALGGEAVAIDLEPFLEVARLLYEGPWVAERVWATQGVERTAMLPVLRDILGTTDRFQLTDVFAAQYTLQAKKRRCDAALQDLDFVLVPTAPTCYRRDAVRADPIRLNSRLGTYTNFMNLLDYSATAVPVGRLDSGVSWGVTLFAEAFCDIKLLGFAAALQQQLSLPLGATGHPLPEPISSARPCPGSTVDVVVCGAHLAGQPLNWQLTDRGGALVAQTTTAPRYALYALPDGKRPALVPDDTGVAIEVEVWRLPMQHFGSFVAGIPAPLGIGKVTLASGTVVSGFICEHGGIAGATNISHYGGWRAYLAATR